MLYLRLDPITRQNGGNPKVHGGGTVGSGASPLTQKRQGLARLCSDLGGSKKLCGGKQKVCGGGFPVDARLIKSGFLVLYGTQPKVVAKELLAELSH